MLASPHLCGVRAQGTGERALLGADDHIWPSQSLTVCKVSVGEAWSAVAQGRGFELRPCHPVTLVT